MAHVYAVVVRTVSAESLNGHTTRVTVADLKIVDPSTSETKNRKLFTDLNDAKAYAIDVMTTPRDIVRDAILATRKTRAHNLLTGLPAGMNVADSAIALAND